MPEEVNVKLHELAPPAAVLGASRSPPVLPTEDGVHDELLQQLFAQEGAAEADIWQTVEACIAPLATLRLTVQAWAQDDLHSTWRSEVAENVLLLLDPAVTAETQQRPPQEPTQDLEAVPLWPSLQPIPLTRTGQVLTLDLAPPPARLIDPHAPASMTLREAVAYATWLEAACHVCAQAATAAVIQPVRIRCTGLETHLGPARGWMESCGFSFDSQGLRSN